METKDEQTAKFTLAIRLPGWCRKFSVKLNDTTVCMKTEEHGIEITKDVRLENGYLYITKEFADGDAVDCYFSMHGERIYSNPAIAANNGKVALRRGPLVYCVEGVDNDEDVLGLFITDGKIVTEEYQPELLGGIKVLEVPGVRTKRTEELYLNKKPEQEAVTITAIPYYAWGNRGLNEMRVWLPEA